MISRSSSYCRGGSDPTRSSYAAKTRPNSDGSSTHESSCNRRLVQSARNGMQRATTAPPQPSRRAFPSVAGGEVGEDGARAVWWLDKFWNCLCGSKPAIEQVGQAKF